MKIAILSLLLSLLALGCDKRPFVSHVELGDRVRRQIANSRDHWASVPPVADAILSQRQVAQGGPLSSQHGINT